MRPILFASWLLAIANSAQAQMTLNGRSVDGATAKLLHDQYAVPLAGAFWYDPMSGLIGTVGQPPAKQIAAGDQRFGRPRRDASGGLSFVVVNGRALSLKEERALEHVYTMMVEGDYRMGPDLVMSKGYPGAPAFRYGEAWNAYDRALRAERQWCAQARQRLQQAGPGAPVLIPDLAGSGRYSVQITQDANGCVMANVQGQLMSRCCGP